MLHIQYASYTFCYRKRINIWVETVTRHRHGIPPSILYLKWHEARVLRKGKKKKHAGNSKKCTWRVSALWKRWIRMKNSKGGRGFDLQRGIVQHAVGFLFNFWPTCEFYFNMYVYTRILELNGRSLELNGRSRTSGVWAHSRVFIRLPGVWSVKCHLAQKC